MRNKKWLFYFFILNITLVFCFVLIDKNFVMATLTPFSLGDIAINRDDGFEVRDASNGYIAVSTSLSDVSSSVGPFFDPDGNVYVYSYTFNERKLYCYSQQSNYDEACTDNAIIDLSDLKNNSIGAIVDMFMDNDRNIWGVLWYGPTFQAASGTQIIKMLYADDYASSSWVQYEVTGNICSGASNNYVGNNYNTCDDNSGSMTGATRKAPTDGLIDNRGNIWLVNYGIYNTQKGTTITCLDGSNSYDYCTGTVFDDDYGAITVGDYPHNITVDNDKNIWVTKRSSAVILKVISSSFGFDYYATTSYDLDNEGFGGQNFLLDIEVDQQGRVWTSEASTGVINCYDPEADSKCAEVTIIGDAVPGDNLSSVYVDQDDNIWTVDKKHDFLVKIDTSNSFATSSYSPASGSFIDSGGYNDATGFKMNSLCEYLGCSSILEISISGEVDPVLTFDIVDYANPSIDTNVCNIGILTVGQLSTCAYRIGVGSNGTNGFQVYVDDISTYLGMTANTGQEIITNVTDYTVDGSGSTEEYGFIISSTPNGVSANGTYSANEQAVPTSETAFLNTAAPFDYTKGTAAETSVVEHKAIIDAYTEAGYYTQVLQFIVTGRF